MQVIFYLLLNELYSFSHVFRSEGNSALHKSLTRSFVCYTSLYQQFPAVWCDSWLKKNGKGCAGDSFLGCYPCSPRLLGTVLLFFSHIWVIFHLWSLQSYIKGLYWIYVCICQKKSEDVFDTPTLNRIVISLISYYWIMIFWTPNDLL